MTEWKFRYHEPTPYHDRPWWDIYDQDGCWVCHVNDEANARFIVQACSSFADLLAAYEQMDKALSTVEIRTLRGQVQAAWGAIRTAIAKAKEEKR